MIAVIGKTEGNGGVNDYTRIIADRAFREVLEARGTRPMDDIKQIPIVWSGGTDGVISPHATIFATTPADQVPSDRRAAALGRLRDERADLPRGHRAAADGREGRRRGEDRHGAGRDHRPRRRPLRADQDPAAHPRDHHRREEPWQGRLDRGHPQVDGRLQLDHRARRRRRPRRDRDAAGRTRSTRTSRCSARSRRARPASSSTRRRSSCSATSAASAAGSASATA